MPSLVDDADVLLERLALQRAQASSVSPPARSRDTVDGVVFGRAHRPRPHTSAHRRRDDSGGAENFAGSRPGGAALVSTARSSWTAYAAGARWARNHSDIRPDIPPGARWARVDGQLVVIPPTPPSPPPPLAAADLLRGRRLRRTLDGSCAICLATRERDDAVIVFACGHVFHRSCATQWLARSSCCPECRARVRLEPSGTSSGVRVARRPGTADSFVSQASCASSRAQSRCA